MSHSFLLMILVAKPLVFYSLNCPQKDSASIFLEELVAEKFQIMDISRKDFKRSSLGVKVATYTLRNQKQLTIIRQNLAIRTIADTFAWRLNLLSELNELSQFLHQLYCLQDARYGYIVMAETVPTQYLDNVARAKKLDREVKEKFYKDLVNQYNVFFRLNAVLPNETAKTTKVFEKNGILYPDIPTIDRFFKANSLAYLFELPSFLQGKDNITHNKPSKVLDNDRTAHFVKTLKARYNFMVAGDIIRETEELQYSNDSFSSEVKKYLKAINATNNKQYLTAARLGHLIINFLENNYQNYDTSNIEEVNRDDLLKNDGPGESGQNFGLFFIPTPTAQPFFFNRQDSNTYRRTSIPSSNSSDSSENDN